MRPIAWSTTRDAVGRMSQLSYLAFSVEQRRRAASEAAC